MNQLRTIFFQGLRDALQLRLALPLYLVGFVLGLLQTWPLAVGLASGRFDRLDLQRLLTDGDTFAGFLAQSNVLPLLGGWVLLLPLLNLAYGAAYNFFSGGVLSVWEERRSFWAGCRSFFLPFCGLGLLLVVAALCLVSIAGVVASATGATTTSLVVGALVLQLLNLVGEYTRAIAVVRERRNPLVLFGAAARFCARHPETLVLGILGLLLHVGLAAVYIGILRALGGSAITIVVEQAVVFIWLWIKLLRLAWARALVVYASPEASSATLPEGVLVS